MEDEIVKNGVTYIKDWIICPIHKYRHDIYSIGGLMMEYAKEDTVSEATKKNVCVLTLVS